MAAAHGLLTPAEPQICHGRNRAPVVTSCAHRAARCTTGGTVRCNAFPSCDRPLMCGAVRLQVPAAAQAGVLRPVRGSPKAARCVLRPPRAAPCPSPANFGPDAPRRGPGRAGSGVHRHRLHLHAHDVARPTAQHAPSLYTVDTSAQPLAMASVLERRAPPRPPTLEPQRKKAALRRRRRAALLHLLSSVQLRPPDPAPLAPAPAQVPAPLRLLLFLDIGGHARARPAARPAAAAEACEPDRCRRHQRGVRGHSGRMRGIDAT